MELSPHDLRRTYAHLGYDAGVPITQIKELLGHASIATTQKYLDLSLDLDNTASDFVPLSGDFCVDCPSFYLLTECRTQT